MDCFFDTESHGVDTDFHGVFISMYNNVTFIDFLKTRDLLF